MESIPTDIKSLFDAAMIKDGLSLAEQYYYLKWLRYYLDFCHKYHHEKSSRESLPLFITKLKDKKQTDEQQKQAFLAVNIFYGLKDINHDKAKILNNNKEDISTKKVELKTTQLLQVRGRAKISS